MSTRAWLVTYAFLLALVPAWVVRAEPPSKRQDEEVWRQPRYAQAVPPLTSAVATAVPDSVRLKVLALLAEGNVTGAVEYYLVATGARHAPSWLGDPVGLQRYEPSRRALH
jgi:hypothetical protein